MKTVLAVLVIYYFGGNLGEYLGQRGGDKRPDRDLAGAARVVDGDTLEVKGEKLRLQGIDAPEMAQTC